MSESLERFQQLLRELFQFDCADLDFGIYRIMNQKRDVIEQFITEDLPRAISEELEKDALAEQSQAAQELAEVAQQITESLGEDALDADGNLAESYHGTPLGKRYISLRQKTVGAPNREALEAAVYNHLYSFFSRYWQDGDFISKRRYSTKRERYAIPYNGEEVYLYWANHDQYYIKTGEYFADYSFVATNGVSVHFNLQTVDVEQNNVKGEKRFFIPLYEDISWKKSKKYIIVPFEYRPLTEQERIAYGNKKQQDKIIEEALEKIPKRLSPKSAAPALSALLSEKRKNVDGSINYLEHHLRQYTKRNTSDFFIHKNLKGFFSRELDFYLKNEVLNLDELETVGEARSEGWFQLMRTIKRVGSHVIDFLHQIEEFQKMLWEKRKFITETFYFITVGNIGDEFYPEIADCEEQWEEWKTLFSIDEQEESLFNTGKNRRERRVVFLRENPTLVVDTRYFSQEFLDLLIGGYNNLDELTDGLLVQGENWQALNLIQDKYRDSVKCTYIDPPYNSKTTEIIYKNNYKHSSWLTLMDNRLALSRRLAKSDGSHIIAIDENEQEALGRILGSHFPDFERVCVAIVHNKKGIQGDYFSYNHDYAYFCIPPELPETHGKLLPEDEWEYANLRKWGRESERETARNCFYPIYVTGDQVDGFGDVCEEDFHPQQANVPLDGGGDRIAVYPIDQKGVERKWRYARGSVEKINRLLKVHVTSSGEVQILKAKAERQPKTVWDEPIYIAGDYGTRWLTDLGVKVREDLYPKSIHTVMDSIFAVSGANALVCDYFAGSGTTGHAVINLNREDEGKRKFILVEMADYFDTVLLPRIKKVTFSPAWNNGKPRRMATSEEAERGPRIIKVIRIESYEDTLNNITFDDTSGQSGMQFDDYLLSYMLEWETRKSETLLNVEKLTKPFSYKLYIHADGQRREKIVEIPETFNYLLGLDVATRRVYKDKDRRYRVYRGRTRDERNVAVIWRETEGWQKKDYERDQKFVSKLKLTEGADEVFVNGDSLIPGARALELVFKARMFAPVEA